ncbi:MAG: putative sulfate exporter family transporter [Candidatus Methanomethyliaceae archaeon]|nr:putative sulfate exporter family transporter [Candidatus Methanomethyliaceae archaeon]
MTKPDDDALWPGILYCAGIASLSFATWLFFKPVSSLMWAFIYSIAIANLVELPNRLTRGINLCAGDFLRGVIAALGIVTSALIWLQVGLGVLNALIVVFFSYFFGLWLGKNFGLNKKIATLIGVGTSICGASAIAATGPAIGAKEEEMGVALACITLFGLIAMFAYPFLFLSTPVGGWLRNSVSAYGIWCGSGVHETAQVIAAAGALDPSAIGPAILVKSIRIFMIGPMILLATYILSRSSKDAPGKSATKIVLPVFGLVFIFNSIFCAFLDANAPFIKSMGFDWHSVKGVLSGTVFPFLLATAFAGVGSKVRFRLIARIGVRAFAFGALMATLAGMLALVLAVAVAPYVD